MLNLITSVSGVGWTTDGGTRYRNGVSLLSKDILTAAQHQSISWQNSGSTDSSVSSAAVVNTVASWIQLLHVP